MAKYKTEHFLPFGSSDHSTFCTPKMLGEILTESP